MRRAPLALFLALAGGLLLGRVLVRVVLVHALRELPLDATLHRELAHLPLGLLHALIVAGLATALLARRARRSGRAGDLAASALAAALCTSALAGWPIDEAVLVPSPATARGAAVLAGMAALSLAASAAMLALLRGAGRGAPLARAAGSRAALALGLALLALTPFALVSLQRALTGRALVRDVVRELAFEPGAWEALERHPRVPPARAVLCPVPDWRYDGGDLPALLMPPPCRVVFEVGAEAGGDAPLFLRAAAGIDSEGYERMPPDDPPITVRFEVLVNGARVFEHEKEVLHEQDLAEREWARVGGARGIALRPGDRVELATSVVSPRYEKPAQIPGLPAGFGNVVLEREQRRERTRSSPETPNVVLIVMDTLRQDRLSCYGHPEATTPRLDALAARGILFEHAYATSSWTWPSTASMLTGLPPETHGVEADDACYLQSRLDSLPELLGARGFATGAFSCNPLIVPDKGFAQGFEDFDSTHGFRRSEAMIEKPLAWLELHASHRFFLYVHLVDTHAPYVPIEELLAPIAAEKPADFPGVNHYHPLLLRTEGRDEEGRLLPSAVVPPEHLRWLNTVYDACVGTADHFVGELLDKLEELGLDDRTVVAFTSDHGEELLDHGLVTHGSTVHRELVRVPLIVAGPGLAAGRRVTTPVSNRHLAPTLAKFGNARFEALPDPLDLTRIDELPARPVFFSTHQGWWNGRHRLLIHGARDGEWELHWAPTGAPWGADPAEHPEGDWRLYHLAEDPWQHVDLARSEPEKARELLELLRAHLEAARTRKLGPTLGAGSRSREMLEAIGYIESEDEERSH